MADTWEWTVSASDANVHAARTSRTTVTPFEPTPVGPAVRVRTVTWCPSAAWRAARSWTITSMPPTVGA